jgi:glutamate racemase
MTTPPINHPDPAIDRNLPIGLFDSGVGGFTVLKQLQKLLPSEYVVYFGDTANVPYGDKPPEVIRAYAKNIVEFLVSQGVKAIAIACNVSSSVLTDDDLAQTPVPVFGLISNGAAAAVRMTRCKRIGILATAATVQTSSYVKAILSICPEAMVVQSACPKFVPLIENGVFEGNEVNSAVEQYAKPLLEAEVDTVIYGCTHYPFLEQAIQHRFPDASLVDPAVEIVTELSSYLKEHNLGYEAPRGKDAIFASDLNEHFLNTAKLFLGHDIRPISSQATVNP